MIVRNWGASIVVVSLMLNGCTLFDRQEKRINYTRDLNDVEVLVTDAKQRGVFVAPTVPDAQGNPTKNGGPVAGTNTPRNIICAEPSPDVAQAISAAFTAAAEVDAKMNAAPAAGAAVGATQQISGSGSLGSSYAASIAQLGERLATVQLLRDKMYRACEGYQNGAITDTSYTLMLARFDKTMASMLASEVAGGAFGRGLASLGGSAATGSVDPAKLKEAQANVQTATKALKDAAGEADDTKRPTLVKDAGDKLDAAVTHLAALELQSAQTAASSGLTAGIALGQIAGSTGPKGDPAGVVAINRTFIDDDASSSLLDACIVALDRNRTDVGSDALKQQFADSAAAIVSAVADIKAAEAKEKEAIGIMNSTASPDQKIAAQRVLGVQQSDRYIAQQKLDQAHAQYQELSKLAGPSLTKSCDIIVNSPNNTTIIDRLQGYKLALRNIDAQMAGSENSLKQQDLALRQTAATICDAQVKNIADATKRPDAFTACVKQILEAKP